MDPSSAQEMSSQTLESMLGCTKAQQQQQQQQQEKKPKPADQQALKCPRCDSTNTKFCYYNNYSLSQPRYFCKSCRRYWTKGGTLRNVPVGGGCRKNKRSSSSSATSGNSAAAKGGRSQDHSLCSSPNPFPTTLTNLPYEPNDNLSLALARLQKQANLGGVEDHHELTMMCNPNNTPYDILGNHNGFLETAPTNPTAATAGLFHNLYYGNINVMGVENNGGMGEMGISYEDHMGGGGGAMSTVKQEMSRDQGENNRVLWSFPWQVAENNQGNNNMGEIDSTNNRTQNWYGFGSSSSWHGLLNSPLM